MESNATSPVAKLLGSIPYRLQLAGGWIDQPFVSQHNPKPPGSMVVVQIEPNFRPMDRCGLANSTRIIALRIWNGKLPDRSPEDLVRELYEVENKGKAEPSGSQDMIGLVYPGVNRLDYDFKINGGVFPSHIESCDSPRVARWLDKVLHLIPVEQRPDGYSPLPHVVRHPLIRLDLMALLKAYQRQYPGAMYSGCGGGYLIVASDEPVPGAFKINVRVSPK